MIERLNRIFSIFGTTPDGLSRVRITWQNLNEKPDGEPAGFPYHGRAWLHLGSRITLCVTWHLWTNFAHAYIGLDPADADVTVSVALPPLAMWWSIEGVRWLYRVSPRELGWSFHNWTLFWHGWHDPNEWRTGTPWWRYFAIDVPGLLFGKTVHHTLELESEVVAVPMPEGPYAGRATLEEHVWKRPRLPFAIRKRFVALKMAHGISDGSSRGDIRDSTHPAKTIDEGLGAFLVWILQRRRRNKKRIEAVICEGCRAALVAVALGEGDSAA